MIVYTHWQTSLPPSTTADGEYYASLARSLTPRCPLTTQKHLNARSTLSSVSHRQNNAGQQLSVNTSTVFDPSGETFE